MIKITTPYGVYIVFNQYNTTWRLQCQIARYLKLFIIVGVSFALEIVLILLN